MNKNLTFELILQKFFSFAKAVGSNKKFSLFINVDFIFTKTLYYPSIIFQGSQGLFSVQKRPKKDMTAPYQ